MKVDLDELERKARAAGHPGQWIACEKGTVDTEDGAQIADVYDNAPWTGKECFRNGEHIAANSPQVTLALISRIRELEDALSAFHDDVYDHRVAAVIKKGITIP